MTKPFPFLATILLAASLFLAQNTILSAASSLYKLPVPSGQSIYVTQGNNSGGDHNPANGSQWAFDFAAAPDVAFTIVAARAGTVMGSRSDSSIQCRDGNHKQDGSYLQNCWEQANYVLIDHGDGTSALYLHVATGSVLVTNGHRIDQGQSLAVAGATGWATGIHLHFQVENTPSQQAQKATFPGWWWTQSIQTSFADPDVLSKNPNGIPTSDPKLNPYISSNTSPVPKPNIVPGGTWISPADGTPVTSAIIHFAVHSYPANPGDPPIDHVDFTVWWPALGPETGPWQMACRVPASAATGDVYGCDGSLQRTPPGQVKISFDVYDQAGNKSLAPNGERVLTYSVASPPPTSFIAYVSPTGDLVISKLDGTNARKLVSGPIARPAWSPDGTRIAYLRLTHPANRPSIFSDQLFGDQIEMVNVDGTHRTVLVPPRPRPNALPGLDNSQAFVRVRWAPDSSAIYYLYAYGNPGGKGVIRHDLAPSAEHNLGDRAFGHDFDIARDGTLALVDYENAGDHAGDNLYLLQSNGTTRYIVSNPPSGPGIESPTWSPDGMTIATIGPGVYVIGRNGRSRTIIDSVGGAVTAVTWSPDGARLAFAQGSSLQGSSIWTVSTSGGTPMKLLSGSDPSWGPATAQ